MSRKSARLAMAVKLLQVATHLIHLSRVLPPNAPWQDCSADLLGPLPAGESILVVVDYFSRFVEVAILKSTTSTKIIEAISPMFARFGVPFYLRTDNGPQFVSEEFESFLQAHGVEHRRTTPLWPQANGEVERQNRSFTQVSSDCKFGRKELANRVGYLVSSLQVHSADNYRRHAILPYVRSGDEVKVARVEERNCPGTKGGGS